MSAFTTETFETLNQRIVIEMPMLTREQITDALRPFEGRLVTPELTADMRVTLAMLLAPKITIECTTPSNLLINLPLYQHIRNDRRVRALKIAAVIPNPRGYELHFENTRYAPVQVSNRWHIDWAPVPGGYFGQAENEESFHLGGEFFESDYTMVEVGA